ncbi:MAG: biopolymer transporter ExbD [Spirochaetes bacterium]|nr:biopolymer transporter ExbD [Spirochaetota bacterium]
MAIEIKSKSRSVLNVSAMADIAFLLLIFFMLSSISEEDKEIPIELPKSSISVQENEKFFNVWINNQGSIFFSGKQGTLPALTTHATYKLIANPQVRVLIRASKDVQYEYVNNVMDALKEAGIHYIVLVSEKKS